MTIRNHFLFESGRGRTVLILLLIANVTTVLIYCAFFVPLNGIVLTPDAVRLVLKNLAIVMIINVISEIYFDSIRQNVLNELKSYSDQADLIVRQKETFSSGLSHEIRNPLQTLMGSVELLQQNFASSDPAQREQNLRFLDSIKDGCEAVTNLITNILEISSVEAGRVEVFPRPAHLGECASAVLRLLSVPAKAKAVELRYTEMEGKTFPARLQFDPSRLHQALFNLVSNSVKFTSKGRVLVRAQWLPGPDSAALMREALKGSDWKSVVSPTSEVAAESEENEGDSSAVHNTVPTSGFIPSYKKARLARMASESFICLKLVRKREKHFTPRTGSELQKTEEHKSSMSVPLLEVSGCSSAGVPVPASVPGVIKIEIMDTGVGIPKADAKNLFKLLCHSSSVDHE
ncbi:MAG: sensor histidine kinase [Candidatus Pacebacteria bacterium]|nr:sensor histidine kinase [Candidatus Paceibacterota bacterium]